MKTMLDPQPARNELWKFATLLMGIVIILLMIIFLIKATPVTAANTATEPPAVTLQDQTDYQALYADSLLEIDVLNQLIQEKEEAVQSLNDEVQSLNTLIAENALCEAALNEKVLSLEQEMAELAEIYGTMYYVEFEIRRAVSFPAAEDILHFYTYVPKATYDNIALNTSLPLISEHYSLPSGSRNTTWTVTAMHKDPIAIDIAK